MPDGNVGLGKVNRCDDIGINATDNDAIWKNMKMLVNTTIFPAAFGLQSNTVTKEEG
jgi:hypothetical protein